MVSAAFWSGWARAARGKKLIFTASERTESFMVKTDGRTSVLPLSNTDIKYMPLHLFDLPEDACASILAHLPLLEALLPTIRAVCTSCRAGNAWLSGSNSIWKTLQEAVFAVSKSQGALSSPSRRSSRLVHTPRQAFVAHWKALLNHNEALHHAVAISGQDDKDLTAARIKTLVERWGPMPQSLMNRASPVYNATLLMQVCRGRVREPNLVACAERLIFHEGCDPSARPPYDGSCTPLIIAASRGLPRLTALLLACGADPSPRGEGRFRLAGRHSSIAGCWRALEWVCKLREAEAAAGVVDPDDGLRRCWELLQLFEAEPWRQQPLEPAESPSDAARAAGVRAASLLKDARARQQQRHAGQASVLETSVT